MTTLAGQPSTSRILFITSGNQNAYDGVTDYTFWLVAAAGRAGVHCMVFVLYPLDETSVDFTSRFPAEGPGKLTVKQASGPSLESKFAELSHTLQTFKPHWISLQFTPGNFRNGRFFLPSLRSLAFSLGRTIPICLTVHESAGVLHPRPRGLHRLLARFRNFEISQGLRKLGPSKVFVSNPQHFKELIRADLAPKYLPIFSNIPHEPISVRQTDPRIPPHARIALLFGRILPDWDPQPVVNALCSEPDKEARPIVIVSIGTVGHREAGWQKLVAAASARGLAIHQIGTLTPPEISRWLQSGHYGISPTPLSLWQKSSTCAAMIQHGLPMIFSDDSGEDDQPLPPRYACIRSGRLHWITPPENRQISDVSADAVWQKMQLL